MSAKQGVMKKEARATTAALIPCGDALLLTLKNWASVLGLPPQAAASAAHQISSSHDAVVAADATIMASITTAARLASDTLSSPALMLVEASDDDLSDTSSISSTASIANSFVDYSSRSLTGRGLGSDDDSRSVPSSFHPPVAETQKKKQIKSSDLMAAESHAPRPDEAREAEVISSPAIFVMNLEVWTFNMDMNRKRFNPFFDLKNTIRRP